MKPTLVSIIIPIRLENDYLRQTISHLKQQSYRHFEILVITDKISGSASPAQKRNLGAKMAQGEFLAFLDDDSYPDRHWLKNSLQAFQDDKLAAVCGPSLTPPEDSPAQQASGLFWSSFLGSGGAGTYRNSIQPARYVDDYPSVNLIVRKSDFVKVKGFDTHHWPGEDTILCLNLVKLNKRILYHPSIQVYHHRRAVIKPHLQQIRRYALHRGFFAKTYPQTSFRLGYLLPSIFAVYLCLLPLTFIVTRQFFIFLPLVLYLLFLALTFCGFIVKKNSPLVSFMAAITIPLTHFYYGILFIIGFFAKKIDFIPHQINDQGYIGG